MVDVLPSNCHFGIGSQRVTVIEVAVEMRKITTRDFDPDLMTNSKQIAGRASVKRIGINLTGLDWLPLLQ